jgi:2-dehydro-3-deoxyphosphogluconate aldolase / (4S)-4-hydroxy-2-oxoglutarate aldolase
MMSPAALDLQMLRTVRCVAIVRGATSEHFAVTARTLVEGGLCVLEFPLTTPGVLAALPSIVEELGDDAHVGVGSVTVLDEAKAAVDAGARFLVTPNVDLGVIEYARDRQLPAVIGAFSPTEIVTAWHAGATAVKVFPASVGGAGYVRELRNGPFPDIPLVPTGGVRIEDVPSFLQAGATAFGMGGALLGSAPHGGSQDDLRARITAFRASALG